MQIFLKTKNSRKKDLEFKACDESAVTFGELKIYAGQTKVFQLVH